MELAGGEVAEVKLDFVVEFPEDRGFCSKLSHNLFEYEHAVRDYGEMLDLVAYCRLETG